MPYLPFISDEKYREIVSHILEVGTEATRKAEQQFNRNVIDPFSVVLEMGSFGIDSATWTINEKNRQAQKSLANHVGVLHQKILGSVSGWRDLGVGEMIDVANEERKIIGEIKNKFNTIKGSNQIDLYRELESLVMPQTQRYRGYTAYYVEIIPKKPVRYDEPFTPPDKNTGTNAYVNESIRRIDGASFYTLVTGVEDALEQVFKTLPQVIMDCKPSADMRNIAEAELFFKEAFTPKPQGTSRRTRS